MFLTIWEDPKIHFSPYCPPKRFQPTLPLLNLQVLSPAARAACVQCLMKSYKPPMASRYWDVRHHKNRPGPGARTCTPLGTRRPDTFSHCLLTHVRKTSTTHLIYLALDVSSIPLFVFLASCQSQLPSKISTFFPVLSTLSTSSTLALGSPHSGYWSTVLPLFPFN